MQVLLKITARVRITHQVYFQIHDFAALVGLSLQEKEIALDLDTQRRGEAGFLLYVRDFLDAQQSVGTWLANDDPPVLFFSLWIVWRMHWLSKDLELFEVFLLGFKVGLFEIPFDGNDQIEGIS